MTYSIIGILVAIILLIINRDVLWGRYVISYLERKNLFSSILYYSGSIFLGLVILTVIVNIFRPVIFSFDENGTYSAGVAKTAFLSNMSHEIRTPINAIISLNRIAMEDPGISDTVRVLRNKRT
jgi:signal transduction histidine kinase